jgi:cellulose synthase (UDP-forming)
LLPDTNLVENGALGYVLLPLGVFLTALVLRGRGDAAVRAIAAFTCVLFGLRYFAWRIGSSLPGPQGWAGDAWVLIFLSAELASQVGSILNLIVLSRTRCRSGEIDMLADHPVLNAPVDVFIATFNESRDILERTILGARNIEHSDLRIWLLDDGARDWVRELAELYGAHYTCRVNGEHAKAGNVNNGLRVALQTGRPPEFILLLDADFVPSRRILRRTLLLFQEDDVGIVQTPQCFFNPDPIQINVLSPSVWPDEQDFFFRVLMPSLDAWGGAFCCGTSAVLRVRALAAIGGMATQTLTEDMLTSFQLVGAGWRTVYLDEPLSLGLAPEGVGEYVVQRSRWCLGAIQQIHTRWSFAGRARLGWIQRVNHLSTVLYWSCSFPFRLMALAAPAVWWWTGAVPIEAGSEDVVRWLLPWSVGSIAFMAVYSRNRQIPILTDVTQLVSSIAVLGSVVTGLVRPWGRPFKVTPKGLSRDRATAQWQLMAPFLFLTAATILGLIVNLPSFAAQRGAEGYSAITICSLIVLVILQLTCLACIDQPRRRVDERFLSGESAIVATAEGEPVRCVIRDISVGGACLVRSEGWASPPGSGTLLLDNSSLKIPFTTVRAMPDRLGIRFDSTPRQRENLILKLFDIRYKPAMANVDIPRAFGLALAKLLH